MGEHKTKEYIIEMGVHCEWCGEPSSVITLQLHGANLSIGDALDVLEKHGYANVSKRIVITARTIT